MEKKAFFQFIKAEQRSLEERKESMMNLQETDLAGTESAHFVVQAAKFCLHLQV